MRFLLCSFSSPGFLFPLVGLALELRRRGHDAAFASGLPASPILEAAGLYRFPRSDRDGESFNVARWHDPMSVALDAKHIEYAIRRDPPDAIITHYLCLSALIVAERQDLRTAVVGPFAYLYPPAESSGVTSSAESDTRLRWRLDEGIKTLNKVRTLFRLPPTTASPQDHALLSDLYMLRTTPCVEHGLDSLPQKVHVVGPCTWEPNAPGGSDGGSGESWSDLVRQFAAPDAPVLYVHNGRSFGGPTFWPQLVEGLAAAPVQIVASVGRMDMDLGSIPPNFLVRDHIPQGMVLPHAGAVLAGGHASVVIGAAMHGVPCVLIPYGVDTPENAERLAAAGCALCLPMEGLTADAVREAVGRVLIDEEMRQNSRALRSKFRAMDSFDRAATLVETMARTRAPVHRASAVPAERVLAV